MSISFERTINVMIEKNEYVFNVVGEIEIDDQSFSHEYGIEQVYVPMIAEINVFDENDQPVTDQKIIDLVTEHYEERFLEKDAA